MNRGSNPTAILILEWAHFEWRNSPFQKLQKLQYGVFPPRRLITWRHRSRIVLMRRATRCCGIAFHSSCTRRRKSVRQVFSSTRRSTARFTWSHKCSIGHPPSNDTHLFATFKMGYPFIQSVLIQPLKQLWDSNHYSSVATTQLFMCAKNHIDWLNNFGNMRPNPKGNLFLLNCLQLIVYKD